MSQTIQVGIFVTLCLVILGLLIFNVEDLNPFAEPGEQREVLFDSVAGLNEKAPVRVAGVKVGLVDRIGLEGRRAKVTLLLDEPLQLSDDTIARVANAGILGDKYIELVPGTSSTPLPAGQSIPGETPVTFDQALERFDTLGQSLQQITGDVSAQGDLGTTIRRLLDNLEATSADIRSLVASNKDQVGATVGNVERISADLARELPRLADQISAMLSQVDSVVSENRDAVHGSLENIEKLSGQLQTTVDNLNAISGQIGSGEGTLGKLIYDDSAHDSLVSTLGAVEEGVGSLQETLGRVEAIQLDLALEATLLPDAGFDDDDSGEGAAAFRLRLTNHPRRFYSLGLVNTPQGKITEETRVITTTLPDGTVEVTTIREELKEDDFTLTAMLGYSMGNFDLRAGLIESSGGAGVDWHLYDRRLRFSVEAFDFSRPDDLDPHLRFTTRFDLSDHIYLLGGYDDPLVEEYESVFLGAGITWRDEDLKYLLGSVRF